MPWVYDLDIRQRQESMTHSFFSLQSFDKDTGEKTFAAQLPHAYSREEFHDLVGQEVIINGKLYVCTEVGMPTIFDKILRKYMPVTITVKPPE